MKREIQRVKTFCRRETGISPLRTCPNTSVYFSTHVSDLFLTRLLLSQQGSLARLGHLRRRGSVFGLAATSDRLTTWLVKGYFYGDAAPTLISFMFLDSCSFRFTLWKMISTVGWGVGQTKGKKKMKMLMGKRPPIRQHYYDWLCAVVEVG